MEKIIDLGKRIQKEIGIDTFVLCGSTLINYLLYGKLETSDVDLNIDISLKNITTKNLKNNGFTFVDCPREIIMYSTKKVDVLNTVKNDLHLDLAFMTEPNKFGHFNIDSIYLQFPSGILVDEFDCIRNIKNKKIIIKQVLERSEVLLIRLLHETSKYGVGLKPFEDVITDCLNKMAEVTVDNKYVKKLASETKNINNGQIKQKILEYVATR